MATIDLGKIKFVFRGTYAGGTAYTPDDVVTFTDSGILSSYICTANTTGNNPSSSGTAHGSWAYLAKGTAVEDGASIAAKITGTNLYTTGNIGRDSNDHIVFTDNSRLDVVIAGNNEFRFEADGDFHADGDVIAASTTISSDRKLKENITLVPNSLEKVQALNGVSFDWKKTGEKSAGVIAQEVQGVLPEAVKEVTPVGGGESHLTVNYHALTSILIESIKELKKEIDELKGGQ